MTTRLPLLVRADHPAFAGHFPGRAIVPGVVLLDLAMRAIAAHVGLRDLAQQEGECEIGNAKFLSPVGPGESLVVDFDAANAASGATEERRYTLRILAGDAPAPGDPRVAATAALTWRKRRDPHDSSE